MLLDHIISLSGSFGPLSIFDEINQLIPVPHICLERFDLLAGWRVIVAVQQQMSHTYECCISQLWEVTTCQVAHTLSHIRQRLLVTLHFTLPCLPNLICTFPQKQFNLLLPNPFGIKKISQRQPDFKSQLNIQDRDLLVLGSIFNLAQLILYPDNGTKYLLQNPSLPYFLPLVEGTKIGLPNPFRKLLLGDFHSLQADWGFAFGTAHVHLLIALIVCIVFVVGYFC